MLQFLQSVWMIFFSPSKPLPPPVVEDKEDFTVTHFEWPVF